MLITYNDMQMKLSSSFDPILGQLKMCLPKLFRFTIFFSKNMILYKMFKIVCLRRIKICLRRIKIVYVLPSCFTVASDEHEETVLSLIGGKPKWLI